MADSINITSRYSDDDLKEFKAIIDAKLDKAVNQYNSLKEQLKDITENNTDDFAKDITDFSTIQTEVEMLNNMVNHQRKYIKDLENALIRINNKSYGICVVTGELIDKKRLIAVPTTTKSIGAKTSSEMKDVQIPKDNPRGFDDFDEIEEDKQTKKSDTKTPTIISKVIKSSSAKSKSTSSVDEDDEFDKIFSELDVIKELDESELDLSEDDDYTEDDLDMIADDSIEEYDDEDVEDED
ncbi:MAG TPA: hypothetical protein PK611_06675 [Saprospiraceae bacterium]|jgi:RNA polymerase-binding protein DksA|nr:TraR/DksA family transcriptional regulator [Saprospiraceae bacterium]HRO07346.1 hypothetical protein [Saprospiraceae bacterium]HRO73335.1 hypothetical protein [Saprospiraceae bacterium]HRP40629.1 hypothetical protein [Saprospiraceae bacterium]